MVLLLLSPFAIAYPMLAEVPEETQRVRIGREYQSFVDARLLTSLG